MARKCSAPRSASAINQVLGWHDFPVSYGSLPIADTHIPDIHRYNPDLLTCHEAVAATVLDGAAIGAVVLLKPLDVDLLKGVVLEMLLAIISLLLSPAGHQTGGTSYGGTDARQLRCVEVEEEGGEARTLLGAWRATGEAAAVGGWSMRNPCNRD